MIDHEYIRKDEAFKIHWCHMDCIKNVSIIKNN
nr:MAG TPA: hypothetical protein [Caudoviricetes sp.]